MHRTDGSLPYPPGGQVEKFPDRRKAPAYPGETPTEGFTVSSPNEHASQPHVPAPGEPVIPEIEDDETIAPRPEEEIADVGRAEPDVEDHRRQ